MDIKFNEEYTTHHDDVDSQRTAGFDEVNTQSSTDEHCRKELEACHQRIQSLEGELEQAHERARYLASDFENFRRRLEREAQQLTESRETALLRDIVALADDFDRAFAEAHNDPAIEAHLKGFELIYKALQKILARHHVTEITEVTWFNPELHEAVMQAEDATKESGQIVAVFQKGYLYKGKVLRPARVSVKP
jgi:molecular chaperone GrpE